jgi:hypothetical protein
LAGQHTDIRLTAEDGYQAQRSYSIASSPEAPTSSSLLAGDTHPVLGTSSIVLDCEGGGKERRF